MKTLRLIIVSILLGTSVFALGAFDAIDKADAEFQTYLEGVDTQHHSELKKKYQKFKKKTMKKAKKKSWDKSKEISEKVMQKYGRSEGQKLLKSVTGKKDKIQKSIDLALKVYSGDMKPEELYGKMMEWGAKKYLIGSIPAIGQIIAMTKFSHEQFEQMMGEIHSINKRALARRMINDKQLHTFLDPKERDEYLLKKYVRIGEPITAEKNLKKRRDLLAKRDFFVRYREEIDINEKAIGYDKSESMYQQREASLYVIKHFYNTIARPLYENETLIVEMKRKLKEEIEATQLMIEYPGDKDKRIIEDRIITIELPKWRTIITEPPTTIEEPFSPPPSSPERIKKQKVYIRIKIKYEATMEVLAKLNGDYRALRKEYPAQVASTRYWPSGIIQYHDYQMPKDFNNYLDRIQYYTESIQKNGWSKHKEAYFSYFKGDISRFRESMNDSVKTLKSHDDKADDFIANEREGINALKALKEKIKGVNYVGLKSFNNSIYNQKEYLRKKIDQNIGQLERAIRDNEEVKVDVVEGKLHFATEEEYFGKTQTALNGFASAVKSHQSAFNTLNAFSPVFTDLLSLGRERANYWVKLNDFFNRSQDVYEGAESKYIYSNKYKLVIQNNTAFLEIKYDRYFNLIFHKKMREADQQCSANMRTISLLVNADSLKKWQYPLHRGRVLTKTQESVDADRKLFLTRLKSIHSRAMGQVNRAKKQTQNWNKYRKELDNLVKLYWNQHTDTFNTSPKNAFIKFAKDKDHFNKVSPDYISKYEKEYSALISRINKWKVQAKKIDKAENNRILLHYSELRLNELTWTVEKPKAVVYELGRSQLYFDIYINTDIGKAKTLYLYLYGELKEIETNHQNVEALFDQEFHSTHFEQAQLVFGQSLNYLVILNDIVQSWERKLNGKVSNMVALKQNYEDIDRDQPMTDILYGQLDSDRDGVPDNVELAQGTDPINSGDSFLGLSGTIVIPAGQTFDLDSVSIGPVGGQNSLMYGNFGVFGWSLHGDTNFHTLSSFSDTIPRITDVTYDTTAYGSPLTVGKVYAVHIVGTDKYGKVKVLSHNAGTSVEIQYSFEQ